MNRKRRLLLFCFIVLAAITVLATSLHDVHFQPGRSLPNQSSSSTPNLHKDTETLPNTPLWKILLLWAAFIVNLFLFIHLLPPDLRKRIIRQAISFSLGILVLFIALKYRLIHLPNLNSDPVNTKGQAAPGLDSGAIPPAFQPPSLTPWMTYLISLGVFLGVLILTWIAYRWWQNARARSRSSLFDIAGIARSSLDDLAAGQDWGDVIIQAYARMNAVVSDKRGLPRPKAATPREYALRLETAGLPAEAVNRLTLLFESVRYGARKSNQADINEAVACLNSILHACGTAP
jgi:hypothetical protein